MCTLGAKRGTSIKRKEIQSEGQELNGWGGGDKLMDDE